MIEYALQVVDITSNVTLEPVALKDILLGFFVALTLRRGRINAIISRLVPSSEQDTGSE